MPLQWPTDWNKGVFGSFQFKFNALPAAKMCMKWILVHCSLLSMLIMLEFAIQLTTELEFNLDNEWPLWGRKPFCNYKLLFLLWFWGKSNKSYVYVSPPVCVSAFFPPPFNNNLNFSITHPLIVSIQETSTKCRHRRTRRGSRQGGGWEEWVVISTNCNDNTANAPRDGFFLKGPTQDLEKENEQIKRFVSRPRLQIKFSYGILTG